jgi:putative component of toxin-antitoxin plasmid stabilization module
MHDIQDYVTAEGKDPFKDWIVSLADRMARARLLARVQRMAAALDYWQDWQRRNK